MWALPPHHPSCSCSDCLRFRVGVIAGDLHRYIDPANISTSHGQPKNLASTELSISISSHDVDSRNRTISSASQAASQTGIGSDSIDSLLFNYGYSMMNSDCNIGDKVGGDASKVRPGLNRGYEVADDGGCGKMEAAYDDGNAYLTAECLDHSFAEVYLVVVMGVIMCVVFLSGFLSP
jgi:hypothetical protein